MTQDIRAVHNRTIVAAVAAGGVAGAAARYGVALLIGAPVWPTLAVNIAGSFALGIVVAVTAHERSPHPVIRPLVATGFLGAFTTYSAFALETVTMLRDGRPWLAVGFLGLSIGGGLAAVWAGMTITRTVLPEGRR